MQVNISQIIWLHDILFKVGEGLGEVWKKVL